MKRLPIFLLLFIFPSCSVQLTPESIIYQDKEPEVFPDLSLLQSELQLDPSELVLRKVSFDTQDGVTLRGVFLEHNRPIANILLFGGNGMKISNFGPILAEFAQIPANVIWFDYRGAGVSDTWQSEEGEVVISVAQLRSDALAIFDHSVELVPDDLPLILHGISMGSLHAAYISGHRELDGLVLDGPITSVAMLVDASTPSWAKRMSNIDISDELNELDNIKQLQRYEGPLLLLVGEDDTVTPPQFAEEIYASSESVRKRLAVFPGIDHGRSMAGKDSTEFYREFISTDVFEFLSVDP